MPAILIMNSKSKKARKWLSKAVKDAKKRGFKAKIEVVTTRNLDDIVADYELTRGSNRPINLEALEALAASNPVVASMFAEPKTATYDLTGLPASAQKVLNNVGLFNFGQLSAHTRAELLTFDGVGVRTVDKIEAILVSRGSSLESPAAKTN